MGRSRDEEINSTHINSNIESTNLEDHQIFCCIHGVPCEMARSLSYTCTEKDSKQSNATGYEKVNKRIVDDLPDDFSYGLKRKVERTALNALIDQKNEIQTPRSSHSSRNSRRRRKFLEREKLQQMGNTKERDVESSKHSFTRHQVERKPLNEYDFEGENQMYQDRPQYFGKNHSERDSTRGYEIVKVSRASTTDSNLKTARYDSFDSANSGVYLGVISEKEAESAVSRPTSFRIYHRLPDERQLKNMLPQLPLMVVYCSSSGKIYHYPIMQNKRYIVNSKNGGQLIPMKSYQVDYGDPMTPTFSSIEALIQYYSVYVHLRQNEDGECQADVFPRWRRRRKLQRQSSE